MPKISPEYIKSIITRGESEQIEFKSRLPSQSALSSTISAFANTHGGTLFVGVDESKGIVGVPEGSVESQLKTLNNIASSLTENIDGYGVENVDGKNVLWLSVKPISSDESPVLTSRGQLLKRHGNENVITDINEKIDIDESLNMQMSEPDNRLKLFVAMSFREEEEPALVDYYNAMTRAIELNKLQIDISRVDLVQGDYEISQKIMDEIDHADIVLADFTLNPQNVYFEIGYARGKGKRILQTAKKGTELSFDVRNWKTIFYRNATELEALLKAPLISALNEKNQAI